MRRFITFVIVGGTTTACQYAILLIGVEVLGIGAVVASTAGYALACILNYWLNYHYTFASTEPHKSAAGRYIIVAACGVTINAGVMALLEYGAGIHYILAQIGATGVTLAWNFLLSRYWTFGSGAMQDTSEPF